MKVGVTAVLHAFLRLATIRSSWILEFRGQHRAGGVWEETWSCIIFGLGIVLILCCGVTLFGCLTACGVLRWERLGVRGRRARFTAFTLGYAVGLRHYGRS